MDLARLQQLLTRDEGPKLDFKSQLSLRTEGEKKELSKLVSAIANSRGGRGYIVFGVEDKTKRITGINPKNFQEEKIQQIISSRCTPPIPIRVDVLLIQGKHVAAITIYRSDQRPHQLQDTGSFFIRRGSTTDVAQRGEIASMLQETGLVSHETTPIYRANIDQLDLNSIFSFIPGLQHLPQDALLLNLTSNGFSYRDSDTGKTHPTLGGMLLFGKEVEKYLPHAMVKLVVSKTGQLYYLTGTVLQILDEFQELITWHTKDNPLPLSSLNEALANALVHRDYWQLHRYIVIQLNPSWISITNPGSLLDPDSLASGEGGLNHPVRNPWLFQNLITLDPKKRFLRSGLGLEKMRRDLPPQLVIKFNNRPEKNLFQVIFHFNTH
ncbi:MAG: putative DNA binding domain-containing protein [Clostridia bacterium]|jgi:predicted HTH transcriptional regulator|nr:putative DNA binding domain-containing protein [Clostridia bacterium]